MNGKDLILNVEIAKLMARFVSNSGFTYSAVGRQPPPQAGPTGSTV